MIPVYLFNWAKLLCFSLSRGIFKITWIFSHYGFKKFLSYFIFSYVIGAKNYCAFTNKNTGNAVVISTRACNCCGAINYSCKTCFFILLSVYDNASVFCNKAVGNYKAKRAFRGFICFNFYVFASRRNKLIIILGIARFRFNGILAGFKFRKLYYPPTSLLSL